MSFLNCVKQKQPSDVPETANNSSCFAFLPRPQLAERALSCKNVKKIKINIFVQKQQIFYISSKKLQQLQKKIPFWLLFLKHH